MVYFLILLSLSLGITSGYLFYRVWRVTSWISRTLRSGQGQPHLRREFAKSLSQAIDRRLLGQAADGGLADYVVRNLEPGDSYRNVAELIESLSAQLDQVSFESSTQQFKLLYQLQSSLDISTDDLSACLGQMVAAIRTQTTAGKTIGKVEFVAPGSLVDRASMMPITSGSHVHQPLGVIVYDENNKVLSKAKVICR